MDRQTMRGDEARRLEEVADALDDRLAALRSQVGGLIAAGWSGAAADAMTAEFAEWDSAACRSVEVLRLMVDGLGRQEPRPQAIAAVLDGVGATTEVLDRALDDATRATGRDRRGGGDGHRSRTAHEERMHRALEQLRWAMPGPEGDAGALAEANRRFWA